MGLESRSDEDCRSVLTELLRLFDWRNEIGRIERDFNHDKKQVKTWLNQYGREKKAAWEAARRVLTVASESARPDTKTPEGHKARHVELHKALDELFADYIDQHPNQRDFLDMPLKTLLRWSYEQTTNPSVRRHE